MLHQGVGGPKDFEKAVTLLARGFFTLQDSESLECLANVFREEIDAGQASMNDVDFAKLAEKIESLHDAVESLKESSYEVNTEIRRLIYPKPSTK